MTKRDKEDIATGGNVDHKEGGMHFSNGDMHIEGPVAGGDIGHVGDVNNYIDNNDDEQPPSYDTIKKFLENSENANPIEHGDDDDAYVHWDGIDFRFHILGDLDKNESDEADLFAAVHTIQRQGRQNLWNGKSLSLWVKLGILILLRCWSSYK